MVFIPAIVEKCANEKYTDNIAIKHDTNSMDSIEILQECQNVR